MIYSVPLLCQLQLYKGKPLHKVRDPPLVRQNYWTSEPNYYSSSSQLDTITTIMNSNFCRNDEYFTKSLYNQKLNWHSIENLQLVLEHRCACIR